MTSKALRQGEAGGPDQNSDSTKLFDLRSPHPGLCVTVYPDGGNRPVGQGHLSRFMPQTGTNAPLAYIYCLPTPFPPMFFFC